MMIRSLTISEYIDILESIQRYHKFANYMSESEFAEIIKEHPNFVRHGLNIKYVTNSYDSRDHSIWRLSFECRHGKFTFAANSFAHPDNLPPGFTYSNMYELIRDFLFGKCAFVEYFRE